MKKSKSVKSSVPAVAKVPAKVTVAKPTAPVAPAAPVKTAVVAKPTAAVKSAAVATVTTPVEKSKRGKKTVFNKFVIKGVEYNDIFKAAEALKMTDVQVYNRVRSTNEKYKEWVRYDVSGKNPENKVK